mmetsp:Transcript_54098/g.80625  ORF Transcript_54098/g.80625 Transcript_54098/m.80625 type:complete len:81 (+) Transcript_54098:798-1040(+)
MVQDLAIPEVEKEGAVMMEKGNALQWRYLPTSPPPPPSQQKKDMKYDYAICNANQVNYPPSRAFQDEPRKMTPSTESKLE